MFFSTIWINKNYDFCTNLLIFKDGTVDGSFSLLLFVGHVTLESDQ